MEKGAGISRPWFSSKGTEFSCSIIDERKAAVLFITSCTNYTFMVRINQEDWLEFARIALRCLRPWNFMLIFFRRKVRMSI